MKTFGYFPEVSSFIETLKGMKDARIANGWDIILEGIDITASGGEMLVSSPNGDVWTLEPTEWAHGQIANKTAIPKGYYDRILYEQDKKLYDENVNHWLHKSNQKFLVRRWQGKMIALLSNSYRAFDNYDIANAVTSTVMRTGIKNIKTSHMLLTEKQMSYSLYDPSPENMISLPDYPNDKYMAGIQVRNSDVGYASFELSPMLVRQVCTNGMVSFSPYKKIHRGTRQDEGDIWSTETNKLKNWVMIKEIEDITKMAFSKEKITEYLRELRELKDIHIDPTNQDIYLPVLGLTSAENEYVWRQIEENNAYEYVQAATSYANHLIEEGYDRGVEIQGECEGVGTKFKAIDKALKDKEASL